MFCVELTDWTGHTYNEVVCGPDSLVRVFMGSEVDVHTVSVQQLLHAVRVDVWQANSNLQAHKPGVEITPKFLVVSRTT